MKLLFDQNISFRLIQKIRDIFPDSIQVRQAGLENATDYQIWRYAKVNGFTIVTFDADFYDYSILRGHPPKIIWIRSGNKSTSNLEKLLRKEQKALIDFLESKDMIEIGCLELFD